MFIERNRLIKIKDSVSKLIAEKYLQEFIPEAYVARRNLMLSTSILLFVLTVLLTNKISINDNINIVLIVKQEIKVYAFLGWMMLICCYMCSRFRNFTNVELIKKDEILFSKFISILAEVKLYYDLNEKYNLLSDSSKYISKYTETSAALNDLEADSVVPIHHTILWEHFKRQNIDVDVFISDLKVAGIEAKKHGWCLSFSADVDMGDEIYLHYLIIRDNIHKLNKHIFWEVKFPQIYSISSLTLAMFWFVYNIYLNHEKLFSFVKYALCSSSFSLTS